MQRALDRNGFDTNRIAAARQAWEDGRARHAANGAVMRTSVMSSNRFCAPVRSEHVADLPLYEEGSATPRTSVKPKSPPLNSRGWPDATASA